MHITATPNCSASRAASTADPTPTSALRTSASDQGRPMRRMAAGLMLPSRKERT